MPAIIRGTIDPDLLERLEDTQFHRYIDNARLQFDLAMCPPGVATEADWMAALWNFSLVSVATPVEILRLLSLAYKWPASGESDAYWVHFQESVDPALMADFDTFSMIAAQAGIDR